MTGWSGNAKDRLDSRRVRAVVPGRDLAPPYSLASSPVMPTML